MAAQRRALAFTPMETRRELIVDLARLADSLGYESVMISEGWGHDSTLLLTEIALATKQIRPVSCILSAWGRTAGTIAMSTATLHDISNGRYILGLGASTPELTEGFHDVPYLTPARQLSQVIQQVRALLTGERIELRDTEARPLRLGRTPVPDQEIHLAALGPRATRLAAEVADGWLPVFIAPDELKRRGEEMAKWRAQVERDSRQFTITAGPFLAIGNSEEARAAVASNTAWYLCAMGETYPRLAAEQGFADEVVAIQAANPRPRPGQCEIPAEADRLLDTFAVYGDEGDIAEGLQGWQKAVDIVTVGLPPGESPEALERLVRAGAPEPGS